MNTEFKRPYFDPRRPHFGKHQFAKGTSGNPGGRPKCNLAKILAELGQQIPPRAKDRRTRERLLAELIWRKALDGNMDCLHVLLDRLLGKPFAADSAEEDKSFIVHVVNYAQESKGKS